MRIIHFNAGGPEFKGREFQYSAHHAHMIGELQDRGHEVLHINPAATLGRYGTPADYADITLNHVREFADAGGCDLFFATAVDHSFLPEVATQISAMGIPTVNLNMDDYSHPYRVRNIAPAFDLVWTTVRENMHLLRKWGADNLVHMPFAANPNMFHPAKTDDEERAVYFIGACYGARARQIAMLAQAGVPVRAYGSSPMDVYGEGKTSLPLLRALGNYRDGWHRFVSSMSFAAGRDCVRGALVRTVQNVTRDLPEKHPADGDVEFRPGPSFDDLSATFGQGALSLGSTELASTFVLKEPLLFIRFREFEAAMCGMPHVVADMPELREYFEPTEMIYYQGLDDMVDKCRYYLDPKRDAERLAIGEAARARSVAEHTWSHRFQAVFDHMGIPAKI